MKPIISDTVSPFGAAGVIRVAETLEQIAISLRQKIQVEAQTEHITHNQDIVFSAQDIAAVNEAFRNTKVLMEAGQEYPKKERAHSSTTPVPQTKKIVAVTRCLTGIAHTFLAAEGLKKASSALGYEIKVETQGGMGTKNSLTTKDIADADVVVIAADTKIDTSRFVGKSIYLTSTKQAIRSGQEVITTAMAQSAETALQNNSHVRSNEGKAIAAIANSNKPYKHLLLGVSHMQPLLIAGGLSIALAFAFGGIYAGEQNEGSLAWVLNLIGGGIAFQLFVAVLSGFIAFSIADRPGLTPGLIGGMLAQHLGAGFLGGIASGFLAGYLTKFLGEKIRLPAPLEGLKPVLILPFLSSILVGLAMSYLIAPHLQILHDALTGWLRSMQGTNAVLLGMLLGGMMAFDMGGPVNKVAAAFAIGLLTSKIYTPMAAVMAAGMTPPLGLAVASWLFKNRFDFEERKAAGSAFVLGLSYITEGAIPYAAKDPLRVIPAIVVGAAVTGAVSMFCSVNLLVPHGGIFTILIPRAMENLTFFFMALMAGTLVTAALLFILKKPCCEEQYGVGEPRCDHDSGSVFGTS